jgi:hypothetical protein
LVDKVLKLSMFEKKEVELRYEDLDMKELVQEVVPPCGCNLKSTGLK